MYLHLLNTKHITYMGFFGGSDGKESGRTPAEGNREWQHSILAWKGSWTEEADRLQAQGCKESNITKPLVKVKSLSCVHHFETPWTIQSMEFSRPEHYMLLPI